MRLVGGQSAKVRAMGARAASSRGAVARTRRGWSRVWCRSWCWGLRGRWSRCWRRAAWRPGRAAGRCGLWAARGYRLAFAAGGPRPGRVVGALRAGPA